MSISINKLNDCNNLPRSKIREMANKLNIDYESILSSNNSNSEINNKICNQIKKKYNKINPCGTILHNDTELTIKKHQVSVANHLIENRGAIVVHSVGTGKTLSAIATAQCLLLDGIIDKIIVVTPTSLQENFKNQMRMYGLLEDDFDSYNFYTIQRLVNAIEDNSAISPRKSLIIIDEAHNLRTINGSRVDSIFEYAKQAKRILLLTATPLINYQYDIINLIALIHGDIPITIEKFKTISTNKTKLQEYLSDIFSFYIKDKQDINFPDKKVLEIFLPMNDKYLKLYEEIETGEVNRIPDFRDKNIHVFYNGLRRASNILERKSPKVDWIITKIKSEPNAKYIIFSNFLNMGLKPIMTYLDSKKINYGYVTGDLTITERQDAVDEYNNDDIKILFISKAGSEGLDLKGTTYIIIMESAWNLNLIEQIIGRGVRYKSHEGLKESKKRVTVYKLILVKPIEYKNINKITNNYLLDLNGQMLSVDLYLRNYAWLKQQELIKFYKILQKHKIDH
ncbi:MAG: chromodomain helicase DNA binding protein 8 [Gaeavirus sp.]|uniref:Early transcription factor 70 kDa subunit n=1 Tax=Gaeavirus sp. TaxID=2487767 RepID=A0A3G4ZYG4_9VIRU|nr:MAG: chromodomain helicase DNA binding protein 8 [Gaeavirus sp.]